MGKIKDYAVGTMKITDLVTVSDGSTGATKNLTVSQIQGSPFSYDIYTALLTQEGTAAPVATVLGDNTIGTIVWTRTEPGRYVGTLTGAFNVDSTAVIIGANGIAPDSFVFAYVTTDSINVETYYVNLATNQFNPSDDALYNTFIEIRNY